MKVSVKSRDGTAAFLVFLLLTYSVVQTVFFTADLRPDEGKAIQTFADTIFSTERLGPLEEASTRVLLLIFNLAICAALRFLNLVTWRTLIFALLWPLTVFLFSKIYWEFYVFPLCLVRLDLSKKEELAYVGLLAALFLAFKEGNLLVLIAFRLILLMQKAGFRTLAPAAFFGFGVAINQLLPYVPRNLPLVGTTLERFQLIREVVNPEYSLFETFGVFLSSMHFFTLHTADWWIDALFSAVVLIAIAFSGGFSDRVKANLPSVLAVVAVIIGFSEITHAFQNARYYFFFIPVLAYLAPIRQYPLLAALGVAHVLFKTLFGMM